MNIASIVVTNDDGTTTAIPVYRDPCGWIAHHDGTTIHLTATATGRPAVSPSHARWSA